MSNQCKNCGLDFVEPGVFKVGNLRLPQNKVEFVNFMLDQKFEELCEKCGTDQFDQCHYSVEKQINEYRDKLQVNLPYFPMLTIGTLPPHITLRYIGLVTANVTVGTGLFSEFSQGVSDMFGAVNTESGMAHKVNSGEATARAVIATKAMNLGANCVIGVDIDYGVTANNAATVNMQGTAVDIDNLADMLDPTVLAGAERISAAFAKVQQLQRWLRGDFSS